MSSVSSRIPFRSTDEAFSKLVDGRFSAFSRPERQRASRIVVAGLALLAVAPFLTFTVFSGALLFGLLMFWVGLIFNGARSLTPGVRWARAWLITAGLGRLVITAAGSGVVALVGGDVSGFFTFWFYGGIADLALAFALYCIRLPEPAPAPVDGRFVPEESPRAEYERLSTEAAENERRRRELEGHPDINRT